MLVHILPVILLYGPGIVKITETRNLPYFYQLIFQDCNTKSGQGPCFVEKVTYKYITLTPSILLMFRIYKIESK